MLMLMSMCFIRSADVFVFQRNLDAIYSFVLSSCRRSRREIIFSRREKRRFSELHCVCCRKYICIRGICCLFISYIIYFIIEWNMRCDMNASWIQMCAHAHIVSVEHGIVDWTVDWSQRSFSIVPIVCACPSSMAKNKLCGISDLNAPTKAHLQKWNVFSSVTNVHSQIPHVRTTHHWLTSCQLNCLVTHSRVRRLA